MYTLAVVIPTYKRTDLLNRLLESIEKELLPPSFKGVWVVENGEKYGAEELCSLWKKRLPLHYLYTETPGPSYARNLGAESANTDFVIFLDDDVRLSGKTINSYNREMQNYGPDYFYGGPLRIDYEKKPEDWMLPYFPWSVKGQDLGNKIMQVEEAVFLGANHAVPVKYFLKVGGFDSMCPVGEEGPLGEETRLQRELLAAGMKGVYVPDAEVWHFVPKERCDKAWLFDRQIRKGMTKGLHQSGNIGSGKSTMVIPIWFYKIYFMGLMKFVMSRFLINPESRFKAEYYLYELKGIIRGYKKKTDSI